jgi:hypothetical protein
MSEQPEKHDQDTMRDEYDFTKGVRGKHAYIREGGTNLVLPVPDVIDLFPDSASVNEALRPLARLAREQAERVTG